MREKVKSLLPTFGYEKIKKIGKILKYCEVESENLNEVAESLNEDEICSEEDHCHYLKYSEATPESVALELIYNLYNALECQSKNYMYKKFRNEKNPLAIVSYEDHSRLILLELNPLFLHLIKFHKRSML